MITLVDAQLRHEASVLGLRFACEHCVHFASDRKACGNGYPVEPHHAIDLDRVSEILFCKEFELA